MSKALRKRLTRPVVNHDDSGSMILALFVIMILTSLVSVVLMVTISQQAKTRKATDFTFAGQAASSAVNDALFMANKNADSGALAPDPAAVKTWNKDNPRSGQTGDFKWSWYWVDDMTDPDPTTPTWVINATGCRFMGAWTTPPPPCTPSSVRTVTATLTGHDVEGVAGAGWVLDPERNFGRALFADEDLILKGTVAVTAYDAVSGWPVPKRGEVGTNGLATFGPLVSVDGGVYLSNTRANSSSTRCYSAATPSLCDPSKVQDSRPKLEVSDLSFMNDKCPEGPREPWVASDRQQKLGAIGAAVCYASLNFNMDTTIVGDAGNPARVYVDGPITVGAGVSVNHSAVPVASKLRIFSSGGVVSIAPSSATPTTVAWALWAPKALCSLNGTTAEFVTIYGSTVCRKISVQGPRLTANWDNALGTAPEDGANATVWQISEYREGGYPETGPPGP